MLIIIYRKKMVMLQLLFISFAFNCFVYELIIKDIFLNIISKCIL